MIVSKLALWVAVWFQLIAASAISVAFAGTETSDSSFMHFLPLALLLTAGVTSLLARRLSSLD